MSIRNKSLSLSMALSGLERNDWEDFKYLYDEGTKIANALSRSTSSSSIRTIPSSESGIASFSADDQSTPTLSDDDLIVFKEELKHLDTGNRIIKYLESLNANELEVQEPAEEKQVEPEPFPVHAETIPWSNRNLLDLFGNLIRNPTFCSPSQLAQGVDSYFNNRSQFSRLQGAAVPLHDIFDCNSKSCKFIEYIYN